MSHALRGIPRVSEALRIPRDIAVAALSVHDGNADAGIDQNPFGIGRAACGMIVAQILRGGTGVREFSRELLVEGAWVEGPVLPERGKSPTASALRKETSRTTR